MCDNPIVKNIKTRISNDELTPPPARGSALVSQKDNMPIEIHHENGNPEGPFHEMHETDHRFGDNYQKNHPTVNKPSEVDRDQFRIDKKLGLWLYRVHAALQHLGHTF